MHDVVNQRAVHANVALLKELLEDLPIGELLLNGSAIVEGVHLDLGGEVAAEYFGDKESVRKISKR
jgi:hypothetical protein